MIVKDLKIEMLSLITQVGLECNHKCFIKTEAEGKLTHRVEGAVKVEAEIHLATNQEMPAATRS